MTQASATVPLPGWQFRGPDKLPRKRYSKTLERSCKFSNAWQAERLLGSTSSVGVNLNVPASSRTPPLATVVKAGPKVCQAGASLRRARMRRSRGLAAVAALRQVWPPAGALPHLCRSPRRTPNCGSDAHRLGGTNLKATGSAKIFIYTGMG